MRRIEVAFNALQIIGRLMHLDHQEVIRRKIQPWKSRERRLNLAWPHVSPEQAACLANRVRDMRKFLGESSSAAVQAVT